MQGKVSAPAFTRAVAFVLVVAAPLAANAVQITYLLSDLGSGKYEADYTIFNDSAFTIELFDIYFDASLYANLKSIDAPAGFDPMVFDPLPFDPTYVYDVLSLGRGIGTGETLGGFKVQFDWLDMGLPVPQSFDIVHPLSLNPIESGRTVLVNEPSSLGLLLGIGLVMLYARRKSLSPS